MFRWIRMFDFNSYAIGSAVVAAVGLTAAVYSGVKQKQAVDEQEDEADAMKVEASATEARIFEQQGRDAANNGEATVKFGIDDEDNPMGSYDDFLTPTSMSSSSLAGGTSGKTGLGFSL